ncbi:MAG: S41 family peptidase [Bacillota bacterium]
MMIGKNSDRERHLIYSTVVITVLFIFGIYNFVINTPETKKFAEIKEILNNNYYVPLDQNRLTEGAISGMVDSIGDKYTQYLNKEDWDKRKKIFAGEYTGIGITYNQISDGSLEIKKVVANSPAFKADLKVGDIITKLDGIKFTKDIDAKKMFSDSVKPAYDLTIFRPSTKATFNKSISKEIIDEVNVTSRMIKEGIGYIRIAQFDDTISSEFKSNFESLKQKNMKTLILDVRDDPGGSLEQVIEICDFLLPKCTIVSVKGKNTDEKFYYSDDKGETLPIKVLTNENSASASEVLSAALHDNNRAKLIGTKTYGKGLVQNYVELSDGSAIYYTEARYFTPKGICIHGIGIEPDIKVENPKKFDDIDISEIPAAEDAQLQAALR